MNEKELDLLYKRIQALEEYAKKNYKNSNSIDFLKKLRFIETTVKKISNDLIFINKKIKKNEINYEELSRKYLELINKTEKNIKINNHNKSF